MRFFVFVWFWQYKEEAVAGIISLTMRIQGSEPKVKLTTSNSPDNDNIEVSFDEAVRILHFQRNEGTHTTAQKRDVFPFDPDSYGKQSWDLLVMLLLLFTTFAVPYMLAFGTEIDTSKALTAFQIWDLMLDIIFCLDIILSFCTAYASQGVYVTDMGQIAKHYLKGWFWIDVPGSIPVDKIITYTSTSGDMGPTLKILKFIRILKMVRAVRFLNKLSQLEEKDRSGSLRTILKVFRSLFLMMFSAHFLGCMFVLLRASSETEDLNNWMDAYDPELRDQDNIQIYVVCLYWALATVSTVGYGDVLPVNHVERTYSVFVALIGVVIFAFAMGNITTLMASTQGARLRFDDKLRTVSEYLTFRDVNPTLKRRVLAHFGSCWRQSGELFEEPFILDGFPRQLRKQTFEHVAFMPKSMCPC